MENKIEKRELTPEEKKERIHKIFMIILPILSIALLIGLWFLAGSSETAGFPTPQEVFARYKSLMDRPIKGFNIFGHVLESLRRVFTALALAWVLGISFGVLIGWNKKADALLTPIFTAFRSVPPLAWIPLITIWFGIGEGSQILIVFIGCISPIVVNTQAGMQNASQLFLDVGTVFNASDRQKLFQIAIPSALDAILAGVRTSTSAAWMVVLAAEMLGGKSGVGFLIVRGMDSLDLPLVLLSMIFIGVVGALLAVVIQLVERGLCPWKQKTSV